MVDTLELDGRVVLADTNKASALAPVFFPSLPPVSDRWQTEIGHTWSTHRPPGVPGSVEVSIAEVVSAVCQMSPKAAPGLDDILVSVLKEHLYIIAPWLALIYTGFVVSSLLSGVMEDSKSSTAEETWQVFVLYPPQLSTHQLALPPWESPREDCEPEIDASARVSLLAISISVRTSRKSAGSVCLPSDHRGYLFGIQMWAAGPGGGT